MRRVAALAFAILWTQQSFAADLPSSDEPTPNPRTPNPDVVCGGFYDAVCPPIGNDRYRFGKLEVWGFLDMPVYATGTRQAPNGVYFDPLFAMGGNFNIGLIPDKKLYLFGNTSVWMQRPGAGITNPSQGNLDFSKREFDFNAGIAWNYFGSLELRVSAYALNNLNRGVSLSSPAGFKDGVLIENRYYFGSADKYDVSRLSFVSLGYYPTKSLVGGNGEDFHPGMFARAYVTYDIPFLNSYLYGDVKYTAERAVKPRLLELDAGWALRPFAQFRNLEFRVGSDLTTDLQDNVTRDLVYGAVRLGY
jgi:hypothetical protein